jgi:hypothetical protein
MFKIAGGIILAVIGLFVIAIVLQLLPIGLILAPDALRAVRPKHSPQLPLAYTRFSSLPAELHWDSGLFLDRS